MIRLLFNSSRLREQLEYEHRRLDEARDAVLKAATTEIRAKIGQRIFPLSYFCTYLGVTKRFILAEITCYQTELSRCPGVW